MALLQLSELHLSEQGARFCSQEAYFSKAALTARKSARLPLHRRSSTSRINRSGLLQQGFRVQCEICGACTIRSQLGSLRRGLEANACLDFPSSLALCQSPLPCYTFQGPPSKLP